MIKKLILMFVILIFGVLASRTLFTHNYYFNMHDDLQMMRQIELEKCFKDFQIPCRWVPDMGYGFGLPLFNFYPQLPYLFGEVFRLFQLPFNDVAKLTFAIGIIASGFAMYLLASEFFGTLGGLTSSIFYMWAPYRAVDVYVRGAMNESWGFIWFPLILWSVYKLIKDRKNKYLIIFSVSLAGLLLSHNLMVMIFAPVGVVWALFWLLKDKSVKSIPKLFLSGILAFGLSAFFTFPAVFEQKYVHIDSLVSDYFQYAGHFATFNQLFISRFWGDGPSVFGPIDGMAFPVGQIHWILILLIIIFLVFRVFKNKRIELVDWVIIFSAVVGTGGAFMSHEKSSFVWIHLPVLKFVQFPWRFLTLAAFGYSFAVGSIFFFLKRFRIPIFIILSFAVIIFNWNYFKPVHGGPLTDEQKFSGEAWRLQTQAGIRDYLPISANVDPNSPRKELVKIVNGSGVISNESYGTNWAMFNVESSSSSVIRVGIFDFPDWRASIDGKETNIYVDPSEKWGRMYINVGSGSHHVNFKLQDTTLRSVSNVISLISWLLVLLLSILNWKMIKSKSARK